MRCFDGASPPLLLRCVTPEEEREILLPTTTSHGSGFFRFRLLLLHVLHRGFNRVFGQHGTVQLHRRQVQVVGDFAVFNLRRFVDVLSFHPLRGDRGRRDRTPAPERFEARVRDVPVVVYADLEFHHVPARRRAD